MSRAREARRSELRRAGNIRPYNTDPPSVGSSRAPTVEGSMFDLARYADAIRRGLVDACPPLEYPNDELLAATMISLGMPRFAAEQVRYSPPLRANFVRMWSAVQLAAQGHPQAKEIVDVARATFDQMRRAGTIADDPAGGGIPGDYLGQ